MEGIVLKHLDNTVGNFPLVIDDRHYRNLENKIIALI